MSMQMLKTRIVSLGHSPLGDTEDALRKQLALIANPEQEETKAEDKTEAEAVALKASEQVDEPGEPIVDNFGQPIVDDFGEPVSVKFVEQEKADGKDKSD